MKKYFWIFFIVLFAGFIRLYQLSSIPPSLNSDEVAIGYNAYSILTTGRDEYNRPFPLTFRSFDDYKMPVYVYMVAGTMKIFGYNDFSVRFPSALLGTLSVLFVYLLVKELLHTPKNSRYVPVVAAFLFAISPWSIMFSRSGYEANVSVFFIICGTYVFLKSLQKPWLMALAAVLFSLSIWTYHTCRIFVPLLLLGIAAIYRKELWKRKLPVIVALTFATILVFL